MRRFVSPYKKYVCWAVLLNILSAIFNVFSFSLLIPILNILFKTNAQEKVYQYMDWEWSVDSLKETAINNFYYYVNQLIDSFGHRPHCCFWDCFCRHDFSENSLLLWLYGCNGSFTNRHCAGYTYNGVHKSHLSSFRLLFRRKKRRYYCPNEWRCGRN